MKFLFLSMMIASAPLAFCEPVTVDGTDVTFEPPQGFTRLSEERIALKFPNKGAPRFVFGNKAGTTTVAYDLRPKEIPQEKLGDVEKLYTQLLEKGIPGIEWKNKGIIELAGQKWVLFEMTSSAADTDIHNIMLMTGYKGQALLFNFNSTKQEFPLVEKALRESIASIKIPAETAPRK